MPDSLAVQKHYRVRELADLWGFSENTIIKLCGFRGMPISVPN